jgi:hypothetical protein
MAIIMDKNLSKKNKLRVLININKEGIIIRFIPQGKKDYVRLNLVSLKKPPLELIDTTNKLLNRVISTPNIPDIINNIIMPLDKLLSNNDSMANNGNILGLLYNDKCSQQCINFLHSNN